MWGGGGKEHAVADRGAPDLGPKLSEVMREARRVFFGGRRA